MIKITEGNRLSFWELPELLMKTASFLSPKNIARVLTVCTSWYQYLGSNELWIKLCPRISVENPNDHFYLTRYPDLMGIHFARRARMGHLKVLKTLYGIRGAVRSLQVLGESIMAGSEDGKIHIWDRSVCLHAPQPDLHDKFRKDALDVYPFDSHHPWQQNGVAYLAIINNNFVIAGLRDTEVLIKDRSTKHTVCSLIGHTGYVTCLEVGDNIIVSGSQDETIRIWDEAGSLQRVLRGHQAPVRCLQVIGKTIISGFDDGAICIWDQNIDVPLRTLHGHKSKVTCLKVTDTAIVSGDEDMIICIWDRATYILKHTLKGQESAFEECKKIITCLEIVDNIIISASQHCAGLKGDRRNWLAEHSIHIWDLFTGALLHTRDLRHKRDLNSPICCMKFIDNTLIAGYESGHIRIWGL